MALMDTFVKRVKDVGKHADSQGMYLHVVENGSKYWRIDYRFAGKRKTIALGVYPSVSLADARRQRDRVRESLANGIDPIVVRRKAKEDARAAAKNTFEATARSFYETKKSSWSESYAERWLKSMERDLFPFIGKVTMPDLTVPMLLSALRKVEKRSIELAHNLCQWSGQVFRHGVAEGFCARNPVPDLRGALKPLIVKHMAAVLEPEKVGQLLRAMEGYSGTPETKAALKLTALLLLRPGNIRKLEWKWVDLEKEIITIPSMDMKRILEKKMNGSAHLVPLAPQAIEILQGMIPLTGHRKYVFTSMQAGDRPMSENTITSALRRMGFSGDEMTAHGFRATSETLMLELGISKEIIEVQLAHSKSNTDPLGAAYDRAEYLKKRRKMMHQWADYIDALRKGAEAKPLRAKS